jgi:hypothetical protein
VSYKLAGLGASTLDAGNAQRVSDLGERLND